MSAPRVVIAEFDDTVGYQMRGENLSLSRRAVNRFHTGRETFPLGEDLSSIRTKEWDEASWQVRATHAISVRVRVWSDGEIELIPRSKGDNA